MADSPEEIKKHIPLYMMIGGTLILFTFITVAVAKIPFLDIGGPGVTGGDIVLGLAIATFKASLVAAIFMHMKGEKILIYKFLVFTVVFVIGLFALTALAFFDPQEWEGFDKSELFAPEAK